MVTSCHMKTEQKTNLTIGGLITAACQTSGARRVTKMVRRLVLLTVLMGCAGYMNAQVVVGGYVEGGGGVVVVPAPVPWFGLSLFGGDYERDHHEYEYSHRGYESRRDAHRGGGRDRGGRR